VPQPQSTGGMFSTRPGRGAITLMVIHVVATVATIILRDSPLSAVADALVMVPRDVILHGRLWQPFTSVLIYPPSQAMSLMFLLLTLWWFGTPLEGWWGTRGLYKAYAACSVGGALFTLLLSVLVLPLGKLAPASVGWTVPHLGAAGGSLGLIVCWGAVQWHQRARFFFLGEMQVRTFVLILVGVELLFALGSPEAPALLGGASIGFLYGRGLLRPARLRNWLAQRRARRKQAERKRARDKAMERFEVIDGGREDGSDVAGKPLWGRRDDEDDPVVH